MIPRRKGEKIFLLVVSVFAICVIVFESIRSVKNDTNAANMIYGLYGFSQQTLSEKDVAEYTFTKTEDEEKIWETSKICNIYEYAEYEKMPLVYGQMQTLFGEPLYETENVENQYEYIIAVTDKEGTVTYLTVYSGPSGPAIGGRTGDERAASALFTYICSAEASDYDYEGYYMDIPCKVREGVEDGVPYHWEEELHLSDEEYLALYERVYGVDIE